MGTETLPTKNRQREVVWGEPLDLSTDPSVPKPEWQIKLVETGAGLSLADRKLFNVLLAHSWEHLADASGAAPVFKAPAAALRRAIGEDSENSNARLRESFNRLMQTICQFPYLSADGHWKEGGSPLLSFRALPKGSGEAEWQFPDKLRPLLAEPGAWARIHLQICTKFGSKYGLILYELLSLRANLRNPQWEVSLEELRRLLGVGATKLANFAHFEKYAIRPAVTEVNDFSGFFVTYETRRATGKGRKVEKMIFHLVKKDLPDLAETARLESFARDPLGPVAPVVRDPDTLDLADGLTDRERGASAPSHADDLRRRIPAKRLAALEAEFPMLDVEAALSEWAVWAAAQDRPCRNPSVAFRGFLAKRVGDVAPAPPPTVSPRALSSVPQPVLSALEQRALRWLACQSAPVRLHWSRRAERLGVDIGPGGMLPERLGRWIGAVAAEIEAAGHL